MYTRLKVAAALALLDDRGSVSSGDWELSLVVMKKSDGVRAGVEARLRQRAREENVARGRSEGVRALASASTVMSGDKKRIARNVLSKVGVGDGSPWLGANALKKAIANRDHDLLVEVLDDLVSEGLLERREMTSRSGVSGIQYRRL